MLLRRCKYLIRKCQFQEISAHDSTGAMMYLQNDLASVIDHDSEEEKKEVGDSVALLSPLTHICLVTILINWMRPFVI